MIFKRFPLVLLCVGFICLCLSSCSLKKSVSKHGGTVVELKPVNGELSSTDVHNTVSILTKRLDYANVANPVVIFDSSRAVFRVEMPLVIDGMEHRGILTQKGEIKITETYTIHELMGAFASINGFFSRNMHLGMFDTIADPNARDNGLFSLLYLESGDRCYGMCEKTAAMKIDSLFAIDSVKAYLPSNWSYAYADDFSNDHLYQVVFLKDGSPDEITYNMIKSISMGEEEYGKVLNAELYDEYIDTWGSLTGTNVRRALAIQIDDNVISAPIVNEKINGGKFQVSGVGTERINNAFVSVLGGTLPVALQMVSIDYIEPQSN